MTGLAVLVLLQVSALPPDPGAVARAALSAVEADTSARLERAWTGRRDPLAAFGLGMISLYTYRPASAETHLRSAQRGARPESALDVWSRLGLAGIAYSRGQMAAADSQYGDVSRRARAAHEYDAEWEALLAWAPIRRRQGGTPSPRDVLARADSIGADPSPERRYRIRCARAAVSSFSVKEVYHTADSAARAGKSRLAARCLFTAAYQITHQGYSDSAAAWLRRVADWQRAARDRTGLATTLQTAGYNELNRGQHVESRRLYDDAVRTGRAAGNQSAILWSNIGQSLLHLALDDLDGAATFGQRADSLAVAAGDSLALAMNRGTLAYRAAIAGSPTAMAAALRYREATQAVGRDMHTNALRLLAELSARRGRPAVAAAYLDTATTWAEELRSPGDLFSIADDRARLALRSGDATGALRLFVDVVASARAPGPRLEARTGHAVALLRSGDVAAGTRLLQAVADSIDGWRSTLTDEQVRRSVFDLRDLMARTPPLGQAIVELARRGAPETALSFAERRRARRLLDRLAVARGLSDGTAAPAALRRTVVPAAAALATLPDPRMVALEYVLLPDEPGTVLVVSRDGVHAASVPSGDSLAALVERFRALIESGADAASLARTLGRLVLDPALALAPADLNRVVVVADGALHALPFDALRLDDGRAAGDRFAFSMAPSLAVMARLWTPRTAAGAPRILALGDPVFATPAPGDPAGSWHRSFAASGGLPRLAASGAEARGLEQFGAPTTVRVRRDASESFLASQDLTPFRIVHLGTHAYVDQRSGCPTALALAPGGGKDGFLTVAELSALRFDADLLTLSSCRTGQGVVAGSEGLQGLVTAAFEAGARAVLASNWTVADRAAAEFTMRFYREAASGATLDEALASTKRALARAGRPAREWAGFSLWGNGLARLPLRLGGTTRR